MAHRRTNLEPEDRTRKGGEMRLAEAVAAFSLLALPSAAWGQFAEVQAPSRIMTAVPFTLDITLPGPPADAAPPPRHCRGSTGVFFGLSDRSAIAPKDELRLFPNQPRQWGPFTFHKPGQNTIYLYTDPDGELIGGIGFVVVPPAGPIRVR
jgi:hypothetical protein